MGLCIDRCISGTIDIIVFPRFLHSHVYLSLNTLLCGETSWCTSLLELSMDSTLMIMQTCQPTALFARQCTATSIGINSCEPYYNILCMLLEERAWLSRLHQKRTHIIK